MGGGDGYPWRFDFLFFSFSGNIWNMRHKWWLGVYIFETRLIWAESRNIIECILGTSLTSVIYKCFILLFMVLWCFKSPNLNFLANKFLVGLAFWSIKVYLSLNLIMSHSWNNDPSKGKSTSSLKFKFLFEYFLCFCPLYCMFTSTVTAWTYGMYNKHSHSLGWWKQVQQIRRCMI